MSRPPAKQAASGRRADGTFAPGVSGNPQGRPPRPDFALLVAAHRGDDLHDDLLAVYTKLLHLAKQGDVAACRLLLDRTCVADKFAVEHSGDVRLPDPPSTEESTRQLASILTLSCRGDPPAAAALVRLVLRGVGDAQIDAAADAIAAQLSSMPVAAHARSLSITPPTQKTQ